MSLIKLMSLRRLGLDPYRVINKNQVATLFVNRLYRATVHDGGGQFKHKGGKFYTRVGK